MALLDVSLVTRALTKLLHDNIVASPAWQAANPLTVSPQPPDELAGARTLGLYLYHLRETAHTKAQDWPIDDEAPQRYAPMGLSLHYMMTAHSDISDTDQRMYAEQLMMGLGVKTMRDYAKLTDTSTVGGALLFPIEMRGRDNVLRVSLQPIQFNEAMHYWTAGSQALRLAAYYEVAATMLEPERANRRRGRVLSYGVHTFLRGTPRLDGSRNSIQVQVPGEPAPRIIPLQPAEVTYQKEFELFGTDLTGTRTELVLFNKRWAAPRTVDVLWALFLKEGSVSATVQDAASGTAVLPGIYGAVIRVTTRKVLSDGRTRDFVSDSNQTSLAITPTATVPANLAVGALGTVTGKHFDPTTLTGDAISVFIGPERLTRVAAGLPAAGRFRVMSDVQIRFRLPASATPGAILPFRLIIDGAESAPAWIVVT